MAESPIRYRFDDEPLEPSVSAPIRDQSYVVCPHCKRAAIPNLDEGWHCVEHGSIHPMRSALMHSHPYVPDWSAA